jgi:tRNA-binding EMAP/Myf-like protein
MSEGMLLAAGEGAAARLVEVPEGAPAGTEIK